MNPDPDLVAQKRMLCKRLREHREAAGFTQAQAAAELNWSFIKVSRLERGEVSLRRTDATAMLKLYGVTDPDEIKRLESAAIATWNHGELSRTRLRMPFAGIVSLVEGIIRTGGRLDPEALSEEHHEPVQRIQDAIVAARLLSGKRTS